MVESVGEAEAGGRFGFGVAWSDANMAKREDRQERACRSVSNGKSLGFVAPGRVGWLPKKGAA